LRRPLTRLPVRLSIAAAIFVALVPFASRPAWACSCLAPSPRQLGARADSVFTGTVARVDPAADGHLVNFDVDTVYKGEVNPSIDVFAGSTGGCGAKFALDDRLTVFATDAGDGLVVSPCAGNPVKGDIDPARYGLDPGTTGLAHPVTGLHRPLSPWLIVFTIAAFAMTLTAILLLARNRRRSAGAGG
jgi:hypothetical protein